MNIMYKMNICTKEVNSRKANYRKVQSISITKIIKELQSVIEMCNKTPEIYFSSAFINSARVIETLD